MFLKGKTYTTIGTPHYMAPEVIMGKGYSRSVDWWSLGVMVFEFLFGDVPFGGEYDDPTLVYNAILKGKLSYSTMSQPMHRAKHFIEQLLNLNPVLRASGDIKSLKAHSWMAIFDWESLVLRTLKPPYLPRVQNSLSSPSKKHIREFILATEGPIEGGRFVGTSWDEDF